MSGLMACRIARRGEEGAFLQQQLEEQGAVALEGEEKIVVLLTPESRALARGLQGWNFLAKAMTQYGETSSPKRTISK